jgi:hypothetical protein
VIKHLLIEGTIVVALALSAPVIFFTTDQERPDLNAIFNGNYHIYQTVDFWNNVCRTAIDESGDVIGSQFDTYDRSEPNGMTVELTYLQPDAAHPQGRALR